MKNQLTTEELKKYIGTVVDLECSVYEQEQAYITAKDNCVLVKPVKQEAKKPEDTTMKLVKPKEPYYEIIPDVDILDRNTKMAGIGSFIFLPILIYGIVKYILGDELAIFLLMMGGVFGLSFLIVFVLNILARNKAKIEVERTRETNNELKLKYECELAEYNKSLRESHDLYRSKLSAYESIMIDAEKDYQTKCEIAQVNYDIGKNVVARLKESLAETKRTLKKVYSVDFIFPKYRNMIAMCTIYEYFMSGRVGTLDGPDGAYNLYETESRQNMIINNLDKISSQLEDIKSNQYTLYNVIKDTNKVISGVAKDITEIVKCTKQIENNTNSIANSTYISACYSKAIAKNTEAIKYIELING